MAQIIPITTPAGQVKSLPADVYLVAAYFDTVGWALDCFVRGTTTLDEALSFAIAERPHLAGLAVFATQVGGARSLRKYAQRDQPETPPPVVTLVDIPDEPVAGRTAEEEEQ